MDESQRGLSQCLNIDHHRSSTFKYSPSGSTIAFFVPFNESIATDGKMSVGKMGRGSLKDIELKSVIWAKTDKFRYLYALVSR